jgi:hypothetical protein
MSLLALGSSPKHSKTVAAVLRQVPLGMERRICFPAAEDDAEDKYAFVSYPTGEFKGVRTFSSR